MCPGFFCPFQLLDGEAFRFFRLRLGNRVDNFVPLFLHCRLLPGGGKGDFFKLAVADNHRVIVSGGNPGTEFLPVGRLKIPFCGHQHFCTWVQGQKIAAPLFG